MKFDLMANPHKQIATLTWLGTDTDGIQADEGTLCIPVEPQFECRHGMADITLLLHILFLPGGGGN